jgi:fatty acid desaturase
LHPGRKVNNFLGQWLSGAATGADLHAYRVYHLTHHKFTQQAEDPDLGLSQPFPTSRASIQRKIIRDLTGQTFFKQRGFQMRAAWTGLKAMLAGVSNSEAKRDTSAGRPFNLQSRSGLDAPVANMDGAKLTARTVGRFLIIQAIILTLSLATLGWLPFLLWLAALATSFQLFLRIRNIAEHACTATGSDDPFTHARTTYAGPLERTTVAPYWVNYHSEHHLFMGVPCYHLPRAHGLLGRGGYHSRMTIAPNYHAVMQAVIS